MSQFHILSADAFNLLKIQKDHSLSQDEALFLIRGKDILKKYFQIKIDGIRSQLGQGLFQGQEFSIYPLIQIIEGFSGEFDNMEEQIKEYELLAKRHKK